ncbi:MAG: methyltransferase domain-containing protein, partial [Hyphococcus sp.]
MKSLMIAIAAFASLSGAALGEIPDNIKNAIDNPNRTEANVARDGDRKPDEVLAFFGVEEGMTVVDLASGGGYFTELIAGAVGPDGEVRAHNTPSQNFEERRAALEAQYAPFENIVIDVVERGAALPYDDNSMDIILLSLIAHHLHYDEEIGEALPPRSSQLYADFLRVLKPGGTFALIEHTAAPGSTRAES